MTLVMICKVEKIYFFRLEIQKAYFFNFFVAAAETSAAYAYFRIPSSERVCNPQSLIGTFIRSSGSMKSH